MLKQHLSFTRATMAATVIGLTAPVLAQDRQEDLQRRPQQQERQEQERRERQQDMQQRQRQQTQQQGAQGASLPEEVRQVLSSLEGTWTVEGSFFSEEGDAENPEVSQRMNGTSTRKWVLNNGIPLHDATGD